jgi:hypothetical protein
VSVKLEEGHLYRVVYRLQSGNGQWYKYEAVMTYLGASRLNPGEGSWNLRPIAGTQTIRRNDILIAEDLGVTAGRDDHRHRAKRSLGRIPRPETTKW